MKHTTIHLYHKIETNNIKYSNLKSTKMRKLTVLLFAIVLGTSSLFANNSPAEKESNKKIREQIAVLLDNPEIKLLEAEELVANIEFTLNTKGEIVVLNVDTDKELIQSYVKARLNYKKIDVLKAKNLKNKIFQISLRIKKPIGE